MKKSFWNAHTGIAVILILILGAWAPADFLQDLQRNYDQYREKFIPVKISMAFNQPLYAPGDTAFFAVWYMGEDLSPVKGDQLINVDLLAGNGSTVQRGRFKVHLGKGFNQLALRKDLAPGEYKLVAYTDWMKNYGPAWYFQKKIHVVTKKQLAPPRVNTISFYPEGGELVEGVTSRVAVLGPPASTLTIQDGQEVITASIDSTGLGLFSITPKPDFVYAVESASKSWSLPPVSKDGVSVRVEPGEKCELVLTFPPSSTLAKKDLYAIVMSRGKMVVRQRINVSDNKIARIPVATQERGEALHQLYIFNNEGQVLAERIFVPNPAGSIQVKMQFPTEVHQREKISGSIEVVDGAGNPLASDVTLTVIQQRLFPGLSYLHNIEWADLPALADRAEQVGKDQESSLNDFLITQKWERIDWERVNSGKGPTGGFAFQSQAKLKGQVLSVTKGTPPADSTVIISYLQKNNIGFEAYTHNGQFEVPFVFDFWGDDKVFCTLQQRSKNIDKNYSIIIPKDTLTWKESWTSTESNKPSVYGDYSLSKELVAKSYTFFGTNQQQASLQDRSPNAPIEEEFNGTDFSVNVADYVVFPKMEDLLREIVPFAQYRKRGNEETVRILYRYQGTTGTYKDDPLYVIDGIMTKNTALFVALKPEDVVTIKIINNPNKLAQLSRLGENGVIFVETKKRDFTSSLLDHSLFPVVGLSRSASAYHIIYNESNLGRRFPDLRSTLHWNPTLITDSGGRAQDSFFASDDVGTMRILIQGVTQDGRPFHAERELKVIFSASPK